MAEWFKVPAIVGTRARAKALREQAVAQGQTILDFSATEFISGSAADELVCNGDWEATTGENEDVRPTVERAIERRQRLWPDERRTFPKALADESERQ